MILNLLKLPAQTWATMSDPALCWGRVILRRFNKAGKFEFVNIIEDGGEEEGGGGVGVEFLESKEFEDLNVVN